MTEGTRNRNEFAQALVDVVAKIWREGGTRVDRERVERLGERYGVDKEEACRIFLASRGDIWRGELVETDEESGWAVATLEDVPSSGGRPGGGV